jgi:hypothetical protein
MAMTREEIIAHKDKPVLYNGSVYILRKARKAKTQRGEEYIQVKLQDTRVKRSFVIARAQDMQAIECP